MTLCDEKASLRSNLVEKYRFRSGSDFRTIFFTSDWCILELLFIIIDNFAIYFIELNLFLHCIHYLLFSLFFSHKIKIVRVCILSEYMTFLHTRTIHDWFTVCMCLIIHICTCFLGIVHTISIAFFLGGNDCHKWRQRAVMGNNGNAVAYLALITMGMDIILQIIQVVTTMLHSRRYHKTVHINKRHQGHFSHRTAIMTASNTNIIHSSRLRISRMIPIRSAMVDWIGLVAATAAAVAASARATITIGITSMGPIEIAFSRDTVVAAEVAVNSTDMVAATQAKKIHHHHKGKYGLTCVRWVFFQN